MSEEPIAPMSVEETVIKAENAFAVITRAVETTKYEYINGLYEIDRVRKEVPDALAETIHTTAGDLSRLSRLSELLEKSMIPYLYSLLFYWAVEEQEFDAMKEKITAYAEERKKEIADQICPGDTQ